MSIFVGECVACGCDLVSPHRWRTFPESYRKALMADGVRSDAGRRLCSTCRSRHYRSGTIIDFERRNLSRDELLDEWHHFTKDRDTYTQNVKAFAEYLGRSHAAVKKALTRAGIGADRIYGEST